MNIAQLLTLFAVGCLATAAILARRHLRANRGLRRAFGGLFVSAFAGLALTVWASAPAVWPLALVMLAGVGFMVWSIHVEQKQRHGSSV